MRYGPADDAGKYGAFLESHGRTRSRRTALAKSSNKTSGVNWAICGSQGMAPGPAQARQNKTGSPGAKP
jgi:hypothetical protein